MIDVVMPQMGESIVEGTLTKWRKKTGERVERDEPLFEISTDKVDTEIPSPAAGVLAEVLVEEGQTVPVKSVVARIREEGAQEPAEKHAAEPPAPGTPPPAAGPAAEETRGPLSPLVRRMAREHGIDLRDVRGTGEGGRITKQDIEAYIAARSAPQSAPPAQAPSQAPVQPAAPAAAPAGSRVEPLSVMRQRIAAHMVMSKRTSPHATTVHKIDMTQVARIRERYKEEVKARYGHSLTFLPFIARAAAAALRAYPVVNASLDGDKIIYHGEVNIGIAVALEGGLIVPVIRRADEMSVLGLQRAIVDLSSRARSKQLKPEEAQGGTFSITNFGSNGALLGTPIINQPQAAILGVGVVEKAPVVVDDAIAIRSISLMGLTFDHRLLDGAVADQFMQKIRATLEHWSEDVL